VKTAPMKRFFLGLSWYVIDKLKGRERVWDGDTVGICLKTRGAHVTASDSYFW